MPGPAKFAGFRQEHVGLVFKLRMGEVDENKRHKIPPELLEAEEKGVTKFVRVSAVKGHYAALEAYESREDALDDEVEGEELETHVTCATMKMLGITFNLVSRDWEENESESERSESSGRSDEEVEESAQGSQSSTPRRRGSGQRGESSMVAIFEELVGIHDAEAVARLVGQGVASRDDVEALRGAGEAFAAQLKGSAHVNATKMRTSWAHIHGRGA